jgi:large subunit ribosomal protein L29
MNASELKLKADSELQQEVQSLLKEQFNLRMQRGTGHVVKTHRFKEIRKTIARIKTILHARKNQND